MKKESWQNMTQKSKQNKEIKELIEKTTMS